MSKNPKCTECGYEFDDEETFYTEHKTGKVYIGDCDDSEIICPSCGKKFFTRAVMTLSFEQIDKDGYTI